MARPMPSCRVRREFWLAIRRGSSVEAAGLAVGVSAGTARLWFRDAGGMPNVRLSEPSGRFLSDLDREFIEMSVDARFSPVQIASQLRRHPSTIRREIRRGSQRQWPFKYLAANAQSGAQQRARVAGRSPTPSISTGEPPRRVLAGAGRGPGACRRTSTSCDPGSRAAACRSCVTVISPSPRSW